MDLSFETAFNRLATQDYPLLQWVVRKNLRPRFYSEVDDVVQDGLLVAWRKQGNLQHAHAARSFILGIVGLTAHDYGRHDHVRGHAIPLEGWYDYRVCSSLNPEQALVADSVDIERRAAWYRIRAKLRPRLRDQLKEWEYRGYLHHTHAQELQGTRIRAAIADLVGHPVVTAIVQRGASTSSEAKRIYARRAYWRAQKQKPPELKRAYKRKAMTA